MIDHVLNQVKFRVDDQMGIDDKGNRIKTKVLILEPNDLERYIVPLTQESAQHMAQGLTNGVVLPDMSVPVPPDILLRR